MARRPRKPVQLELPRRARDGTRRGGARKGAGRKPKGARPGVAHRQRDSVTPRYPVHVTLRFAESVFGLRNRHAWALLRRCFHAGRDRFGLRLNQLSVQRTHVHLIVEADDARALARGVQGLCIRIAHAVNRHLRRRGKVFADRFHAHVLTTPRETRAALAYCLVNARRHCAQQGVYLGRDVTDPYSSAAYFDGWAQGKPSAPEQPALVVPARSWLQTTGWRRHGLIRPWEVPADVPW